jgi:protein-S-isoprenylcysteine O-methyltransferase Ste14
MTSEHASTTMMGSEAMHRTAPLSARAAHGSLFLGLASVEARSVAVNALLASLYAFFLHANVKFFLQTGSSVGAGLVIFNAIAMICFLVRGRASFVTQSIPNRVVACMTFLLPYGMRPVASTAWILAVPSMLGQLVGLGLMIASLIALNRSIGIVAANRGVKTRGPYAWVRHPMYACEILFLGSFLLGNWMFLNAVVACAIVVGQLVRLYHEEAVLRCDRSYVFYQTAVPYRLIPGIF